MAKKKRRQPTDWLDLMELEEDGPAIVASVPNLHEAFKLALGWRGRRDRFWIDSGLRPAVRGWS